MAAMISSISSVELFKKMLINMNFLLQGFAENLFRP